MSTVKREYIKKGRFFYRNCLRRSVLLLLLSLIINVGLTLWIYSRVTVVPERNYYATSGIKAPILLNEIDTPNFSSTPLLPDDPTSADDGLAASDIQN